VVRNFAATCAISLALGGCSFFEAPLVTRGNMVDPDLLQELVPGTSSRADVVALIGSPTTRATFEDDVWIYIGQKTQSRVGRTLGVRDQEVVVLTFDNSGILRDVKRLNEDDAKQVAMASGSTPSPGSEASFLQQLLGNVGRFSAGGFGSSSSPSGAAP
jgi:outer membrane protein assembly factor BamE (lipoprotein component of BamABCDE complex)